MSAPGAGRRFASAALVGLATWGALAYLGIPGGAAPPGQRPAPLRSPPAGSFHRYDRDLVPPSDAPAFCTACHPAAPHARSPRTRAFLNLHGVALDCGTCHLEGAALQVRRFRDGQVVTEDTLAAGAGGRLYPARETSAGWEPVLRPGAGVRFRAAGPECATCHRRGSSLLAGDGLYDRYRRRVLEDLAVLHRLGGAP